MVQCHTLRFDMLGPGPVHADLHGTDVFRLSGLHRGALDRFLQFPPTGIRSDIGPFGDELHIVIGWFGSVLIGSHALIPRSGGDPQRLARILDASVANAI
jgi:hypothetical protein